MAIKKAMPARMRHELAGIAGTAVHGILAAHLYIATKRKQIDAVIGLALAETDEALAETDGKLFDPHP